MTRCGTDKCPSKNEDGSYCTWFHAAAFFALYMIAIVLTWQVPHWNNVFGPILPDFDHTAKLGEPTTFPSVAPSVPPTLVPVTFSECDSPELNGKICCNGLISNCDMRLNEVMYATSHNAMSSVEDKFSGPNHFQSLEKSMEVGYRAFLLDLCDCGADGIQLCHDKCAFGKRDPAPVLYNMKMFLDDNPHEVIMIVLEIGKNVTETNVTEPTPISLDNIYTIMNTIPGFVDKMYVHNATADQKGWPTLQTIIDEDQRIVVFHHEGSGCTNNTCPAGLHYYFDYAVETLFNFETKEELEHHNRSCLLARGVGGTRDFYNVNNFVTKAIPNAQVARQVNQAQFLEDHINRCQEITTYGVNFVTVDFWSLGQLPSVVQAYNKERAASMKLS